MPFCGRGGGGETTSHRCTGLSRRRQSTAVPGVHASEPPTPSTRAPPCLLGIVELPVRRQVLRKGTWGAQQRRRQRPMGARSGARGDHKCDVSDACCPCPGSPGGPGRALLTLRPPLPMPVDASRRMVPTHPPDGSPARSSPACAPGSQTASERCATAALRPSNRKSPGPCGMHVLAAGRHVLATMCRREWRWVAGPAWRQAQGHPRLCRKR